MALLTKAGLGEKDARPRDAVLFHLLVCSSAKMGNHPPPL